MLDKEKSIDAVTVVIPDHMHAHVALAAMQRGKHVYVEKPLTRTPWEARLLTEAAAKYKVATQMGNQGYSHDATRVAAEIIWSGEIGDVTEVHSFRGRASWPQGMPDAAGAGESARHARLGSVARRRGVPPVHVGRRGVPQGIQPAVRLLPAVQLARLLRLRQQPDRRLGHPSARPGEPGAAARQSDERRVHQAGRRTKPLHVPARRRRDQMGVRRAREHAAGHGLLVRHRRPVHAGGHDGRTDARDSRHRPADRRSRAGAAAARRPRTRRRRRAARRPATGGGGAGRGRGAAAAVAAAGQRLQHRVRRIEGLSRNRAAVAKASACCQDRAGPNTRCRRAC